jgi:hypothetical protein
MVDLSKRTWKLHTEIRNTLYAVDCPNSKYSNGFLGVLFCDGFTVRLGVIIDGGVTGNRGIGEMQSWHMCVGTKESFEKLSFIMRWLGKIRSGYLPRVVLGC